MVLIPPNLILAVFMSLSGLAPTLCKPVDAQDGYFSHYSQPPTDGTIPYHQNESGLLPQDLHSYAGVVAVADCSLVGSDAWVYITDSRATAEYRYRWLPVKVFDCSGHSQTTEWMNQNNILGELGYYLAQKIGIYRNGGIEGRFLPYDPATARLTCF